MITKVNVKEVFSRPKKHNGKRKRSTSEKLNMPTLHAYILGMYEDGVPLKEIAKHFDRSFRYVKKTILEYKPTITRIPVRTDYEVPKLTEPDLLVCGVVFLKAINDKTLNDFFTKVHDVNSVVTTYAMDRKAHESIAWLEAENFG
jgi:hypothetical protein